MMNEPLSPWINEEPAIESESKVIAETPPLRTNYKDVAKRYEMAERMIWSKLPAWKRKVIIDCKVKNIFDDRILNEYAHEIVMLAESSQAVIDESLPPVPSFIVDRKPATART